MQLQDSSDVAGQVAQVGDSYDGRFLGVLGGMGPMAGAAFMARLIELTPVQRDQQHIPAILWSDPRVPDRIAAYFQGGTDPAPWMIHGVEQLQRMGAKAIAIPCNTAHLWFDRIVQASRVPVLHIVHAAMADLHRQGVRGGKIGLMATSATLKMRLYQTILEAHGYECIVPCVEEVAQCCTAPIALVKVNRMREAFAPAAAGLRHLRDRGAQAVVLGCTELPLAVPYGRRAELEVPIVDSIDALARASVAWYRQGIVCSSAEQRSPG